MRKFHIQKFDFSILFSSFFFGIEVALKSSITKRRIRRTCVEGQRNVGSSFDCDVEMSARLAGEHENGFFGCDFDFSFGAVRAMRGRNRERDFRFSSC